MEGDVETLPTSINIMATRYNRNQSKRGSLTVINVGEWDKFLETVGRLTGSIKTTTSGRMRTIRKKICYG